MRNKILTIALVLMITLSMSACAKNESKKDEVNNITTTEQNNNSTDNDTDSSDATVENNLIDNSTTDAEVENTTEETNTNNNDKTNLMTKIKEEGIKGINIYCDNIKLGDNISDVEKIYGIYGESNYVEAAKGTYYNYADKKFAFGCNKGDQIFEIRSYNEDLKKLSLSDIKGYFGVVDYENKTTVGEKVIGYKISDKYKLLLVFDNEILDHYSVFYPEITANLMANDPGREW